MVSKITTGKVRFSYVFLFEPRAPKDKPDGEKKYSVTLLIPKSDKATVKALRDAEKQCAEENAGVWGGRVPTNLKSIIHDGDVEADLETNPEYAGHFYMTVSAGERYKPNLVDARMQEIIDPQDLYSGCYGRVSLMPFAYNFQGNKGVSFGLRNVQVLQKGEPLGGISRAEDDFDAVDVDDDEDGLI